MTLPAIDALGRAIEAAWAHQNHDAAAFPKICAEQMEVARLPSRIGLDEILTAGLSFGLPEQSDPDARFGQPPVTLFRGARFYIDALFWLDGTTSIHDHAFSGAFQVLVGHSLETTYSFHSTASEQTSDASMMTGELNAQRSDIRRAGQIQEITAGQSFIHSLFHLDCPSVSIVARTYDDEQAPVQYEYSTAGLAHAPFKRDAARVRAVQLVQMLRKLEHHRFEEATKQLLASSDGATAFAAIRACAGMPDAIVIRLLESSRGEATSQRLWRWFTEEKRLSVIKKARRFVKTPGLRFLLAVLMNVRTRADVLKTVQEYALSEEPARQVVRWLAELSQMRTPITVGHARVDANLLGLPVIEPRHEACLMNLLTGVIPSLSQEESAIIDRLRSLPHLSPLFV